MQKLVSVGAIRRFIFNFFANQNFSRDRKAALLRKWIALVLQVKLHFMGCLVCVCVCVCLYSSTCWFLPAARCLWHTWEVRINNLLLWVFLGASAKFVHLYFWIYHISSPKTKTPADRLLERKRYDIIFALEKTIYIDIGYKSAHYKNRQWRKDTKDKEVTLI